jgi:hypothetical protein
LGGKTNDAEDCGEQRHRVVYTLALDRMRRCEKLLPESGFTLNAIAARFDAKHRIPNKHSKVFAPSEWKWFLLQM